MRSKLFNWLQNWSFPIEGENSQLQKKPAAAKKPVVPRVFVATAMSDLQSRLQPRGDDRGLHNVAKKHANEQEGECEGGGRHLSAASVVVGCCSCWLSSSSWCRGRYQLPGSFEVQLQHHHLVDVLTIYGAGQQSRAEPSRGGAPAVGAPAPAPCFIYHRVR